MAKLSAEELKKLPVYDGTSMATAGKDTLLVYRQGNNHGEKADMGTCRRTEKLPRRIQSGFY